MANAKHLSVNTGDGGSAHFAWVDELRVHVFADAEDVWYAQALEIDYIAQGTTLEEVKKHFGEGLAATVSEHIRLFGSIEKLLQPADAEAWKRYWAEAKEGKLEYSQASLHVLDESCEERVFSATTERSRAASDELPFKAIAYAQPAEAA